MQTLTPKRVESIRDVVAPQRFDIAQLWLELPQNATPQEHAFYQRLSTIMSAARAGGGSYPNLDIALDRRTYQDVLDELKRHPRLIRSVQFLEGHGYPLSPIEVYLLQGQEQLKIDLF